MNQEKEFSNLLDNSEDKDNSKDISTQSNNKNKLIPVKGIKAIVYLTLSIILSVITNIFFKAVTSSTSPVYITYFQCLLFLVFLPFSFVTFQFENLVFKKVKSEQETSNEEMAKVMDDSFSEIMEKKFYETYYRYYKSFYKNAAILTLLYMVSHLLYNISLSIINPIFCICCHSGIGLALNILKICTKGFRFETFIIISIIFSAAIFVFCMVEFFLIYDLGGDNKVIGIIMLICSDASFAFMLFYLKNILKKFSFYLNFGEFSGYFGLFSSPFIFIILIMKACLNNKDLFTINFTYQFLIFSFLSSLSDYFLFQYLKYCTKTTFSNNFGIEVSILLMLVKISSTSGKEVFGKAYFYFEFIFLVMGIVISVLTYDEAENRKLKNKMKTKQNYLQRASNYFNSY